MYNIYIHIYTYIYMYIYTRVYTCIPASTIYTLIISC